MDLDSPDGADGAPISSAHSSVEHILRPESTTSDAEKPSSLVSSPTESAASTQEPAADGDGDQPDARAFNFPGYRDHLPNLPPKPAERFSTLTEKDADCYDLSGGLKLAIVFNHETFSSGLPKRRGTESDCAAIDATFKRLGFRVDIYDDLTVEEIQKVLFNLGQNAEELSCLALFILTHGEENGVLHSSSKPYRLDKHVVHELLPTACPSLAGKPKMIFIQACQGKETDEGTEVRVRSRHTSTDGPGNGNNYKIPHFSDFLIFQAAYHGHYSFRSRSGSWFVQALCKLLDESRSEEELHQVLTRVKRYVSLYRESNVPSQIDLDRKKQIPLVQDTLIREVRLKRKAPTPTTTAAAATATTTSPRRSRGGSRRSSLSNTNVSNVNDAGSGVTRSLPVTPVRKRKDKSSNDKCSCM